jgi:thioredoxin-like negative regulator of GroEL
MKKVLKFSASWCSPCKILSRVCQELDSAVEIEEIDIDKDSELARQHNIRSVPTLVMYENGMEKKRVSGLLSTVELDRWLHS